MLDSFRYDPETETYRATFDGATVDPSAAVVRAVALARSSDPTRLDPLFAFVDPDALDRLCAPGARGDGGSDGDVCVAFRYLDLGVRVTNDGVVEVRPRPGEGVSGDGNGDGDDESAHADTEG